MVFSVNSLGARRDEELIDNGYRTNPSWNTFWDAKATETSTGWSCELRIPFSSLRFEPGEIVTMNFRFERFIKHTNELVIKPLLSTSLDNLEKNMFNSSSLTFKNISGETPVYFTPYVAGIVSQNSTLNSDGTKYVKETEILRGKDYFGNETVDKTLSSAGFDVKYKLDNSNTLDLTLNTDFAQAETDAQVFNLTRYSIFFPEKRQFFLENAGLFSVAMFNHRLFHSRRIGIENGHIVPILGGIRMNGVFKGIQYGLMNMQTNGLAAENIEAKNFSVFRAKKSLKQDDSYIGGIFSNRSSTEGNDYNLQVGVDGIYRLSNSITTTFFGATTYDSDIKKNNNSAFGIGLSKLYQSEGFEFDISTTNYEENFNPEMGFLSIPNSIQSKVNLAYGILMPEDWYVSKMLFGLNNKHYRVSSSNELLNHQSYIYGAFFFRDGGNFHFVAPWYEQDDLDSEWNFSDNTTIPKGRYKTWLYEIYYQSGKTKNYNWFSDIIYGDFFGGKRFNFWTGTNYIFSEKVRSSAEIYYYNIDFPDHFSQNSNKKEDGTILKYWLTYNFAPDLSLKLLSQFNSNSKQIGSNLRLRYNPFEGTDLYVVYNSTINTERTMFNPHLNLIDQQRLFIKFSKTLTL
ncbi:MAG: hypothetical protein D8M58_07545 [Calditrichaeota bacterium]|nr:MAG: hypothetical protein DWQ03_18945 [Calditrichota bacterium]MBL1205235.1 hypothetical protein [Calditrichota bacterium]NOG45064.1 hypothetical protein [Calditrichota bacterium]